MTKFIALFIALTTILGVISCGYGCYLVGTIHGERASADRMVVVEKQRGELAELLETSTAGSIQSTDNLVKVTRSLESTTANLEKCMDGWRTR